MNTIVKAGGDPRRDAEVVAARWIVAVRGSERVKVLRARAQCSTHRARCQVYGTDSPGVAGRGGRDHCTTAPGVCGAHWAAAGQAPLAYTTPTQMSRRAKARHSRTQLGAGGRTWQVVQSTDPRSISPDETAGAISERVRERSDAVCHHTARGAVAWGGHVKTLPQCSPDLTQPTRRVVGRGDLTTRRHSKRTRSRYLTAPHTALARTFATRGVLPAIHRRSGRVRGIDPPPQTSSRWTTGKRRHDGRHRRRPARRSTIEAVSGWRGLTKRRARSNRLASNFVPRGTRLCHERVARESRRRQAEIRGCRGQSTDWKCHRVARTRRRQGDGRPPRVRSMREGGVARRTHASLRLDGRHVAGPGTALRRSRRDCRRAATRNARRKPREKRADAIVWSSVPREESREWAPTEREHFTEPKPRRATRNTSQSTHERHSHASSRSVSSVRPLDVQRRPRMGASRALAMAVGAKRRDLSARSVCFRARTSRKGEAATG